MNNALSTSSFFKSLQCFDTQVGPGACIFPRGSSPELIVNAIYQKAFKYFYPPVSLCKKLKIKATACNTFLPLKPLTTLFSFAISGYDTSDNSLQSQLNTHLTNLMRTFHQNSHQAQGQILDGMDRLNTFFIDCITSKKQESCLENRALFEASLEETQKLSTGYEKKVSPFSKLLSQYYPTNDKMLLHVLGDSFGHLTALEGMDANSAATHLISFFALKKIYDPENEKIGSALKILEKTADFSATFYSTLVRNFCKSSPFDLLESKAPCFNPSQESRIKSISQILETKLKAIKEEEPLYLFGGWQSSAMGPGHGMIYKFSKQKEAGLYSFEIINMGMGDDNHFQYYEKGIKKIIPFVGKKNIPLESLLSDSFVSALYEIYTFYLDYDSSVSGMRSWHPAQLYTVLSDSILEGDLYTEHIKSSDWIEPQHSGTCAFRSLIEVFGKEMSPSERALFETELGIWSLKNYFSALDLRDVDVSRLDFLSKSIHAYSTTLSQNLEKFPGLLSQKDLKEIRLYLSFVQKIVQIFDRQIKSDLSLSGKSLVSIPNAKLIEIPSDKINFAPWVAKEVGTISSFRAQSTIDQLSLENLSSRLPSIQKDLDDSLKAKQTAYIFEYIQLLMEKIYPLDVSKISLDEKKKIIETLYGISTTFYKSCREDIRGYLMMPEKYLAMLKTSDLMARLVPPELAQELGFDESLSFLFMGLEKTIVPSFYFSNPKTLIKYQNFKQNLRQRGVSLSNIPRLFDEKSMFSGLVEESSLTLSKVSRLFNDKPLSFLPSVLLKSIAKQLQQRNPAAILWDEVGAHLLEHQENLLDLSSTQMPPLWAMLIQQGLMMERFSSYYLTKEDRHEEKQRSWFDNLRFHLAVKKEHTGLAEHAYNLKMSCMREKNGGLLNFNQGQKQSKLINIHIGAAQSLLFKQNSAINIGYNRGNREEASFIKFTNEPLVQSFSGWETASLEKLPNHLQSGYGLSHDGPNRIDRSSFFEHRDSDLVLIAKYPKLRIDRTLAYFENPFNLNHLFDSRYQRFLLIALTGDTLLIDELSREVDGPLLAQKLSKFIKNNFDKAALKDDLKTVVFFSSLYRSIGEYYALAQPTLDSPFHSLEASPIINDLIHSSSEREGLQALAYGELFLIETQKEIKNAKEAEQALSFYLKYTALLENQGERSDNDLTLDLNLNHLNVQHRMFELLPLFETWIKETPTLLVNAVQGIRKDLSSEDLWEVDEKRGFPCFICKSKEVFLNLFSGTLFSTKGETFTHTLPKMIRKQDLYKSLFGRQDFEAKKIDDNAYEFVDSLGNRYHVKIERVVFYDPLEYKLQLKKIVEGESFFLLDGETLKSLYKDSVVPNLGLLENYWAWCSKDSKVIFVDKDSLEETLLYDPKSVKGIVSLQTGHSLMDPLDTPLSFLSSFEVPSFINLFVSNNEGVSKEKFTAESLEFPRLLSEKGEVLKFERDGKRLKCVNFPSLYLSEKKSLFYQETDPILILEDNLQNPVLGLMVPHFYGPKTNKSPDSSLKTSINLDYQENAFEEHFQLLEFDIQNNPGFEHDKKVQQHIFVPRSRRGALYLAFSYLRLHEYQKAFDALLPLKSHIREFNEEELKAASAILSADQFNGDQFPQAYAVKTLLAYVLVNQKQDKKLPQKVTETAQRAFQKYLALSAYHNSLTLDPFEELLLIENFGKETPVEQARYKHLSKIIDFQSIDMPSSLQIYPPTLYRYEVNSKNMDMFLRLIFEEDLLGFRDKSVRELSFFTKDYYMFFPLVGSFLNLLTPTSSARHSPSSLYFPEFVSTLYQLAKESAGLGQASSKDLKNYILFLKKVSFYVNHSFSLEETLHGFADFLWLVMQKPNLFPSSDEFNKWIYNFQSSKEKEPKFSEQIKATLDQVIAEFGSSIHSEQTYQNLEAVPLPEERLILKHSNENLEQKPLVALDSMPRYENELLKIFNKISYTPPPTEACSLEKNVTDIQQMLSKEFDDEYEKRAFDLVKVDCGYYLDHQKSASKKIFPYGTDYFASSSFVNDTNTLIGKQKILVDSLKRDVLDLANKGDFEEIKGELKALKYIAKMDHKQSIDDLLILFYKQSFMKYHQAIPNLSSDEIVLLNEKISHYLIEANYLQKLDRLQGTAKKIFGPRFKSEERLAEIYKLLEMGYAQRGYSASKNPIYLVYEHYANIQLYPKQVEKLAELEAALKTQPSSKDLGLIIEAIMGFGKSKVMLPLLALHISSSQSRLPLIVMPDSLIESLGSEITETLHRLQHPISVIDLNRGSKCDLKELQIIYTKLKLALENHETLIFSSKSLQILFLKYIEFLNSVDSLLEEKTQTIKVFQEIFKILKNSSTPIFDEADLLFNCRQETHFSLNDPMPIEDNHIKISSIIFKLILENQDEIPYNFDFLEFNPSKGSLTTTEYKEKLKPFLVNKLIDLLKKGEVFKTLNLSKWLDSIENDHILHSYLMGVQSEEMEDFIEGIEDVKIAHIIALAQAQLNLFIPLSINKKLLEHYGISSINKRVYAIPHHHGKASDQSEFGNPYETINYSIQTYLQQGVPQEIIHKELKALEAEILELSIQLPGVNLQEFEPYKKMLNIYPHLKDFRLNDAILKEACEFINQNSLEKLKFIQNHILPTITTYNQRISANAQTFKMLFNKIIGFTGTMWNAETYPEGLETLPADGIIGNTLVQFLKKSDPITHMVEKEEDSFENLDLLIGKEETKAWIDLSGHFDFLPRIEVVKKILELKKAQGILGVAFYNEKDDLVVLQSIDAPPVPFALSPLKDHPEKRFTLYDHQRTTGADVSQSSQARAVISIGKHLILRDLAQAAWRMRGLEKNQAVDFVTTSLDRQTILSLLDLPQDHTLTTQDIIQYAILNQQSKKASDNLLSQKQKVVAVLQQHIFEKLTDPKKTSDEIFKVFSAFRKLFVQDISDSPREQFGYPETLQNVEKILRDFILHLEMVYAPLFDPQEWSGIHDKMESVIALEIMPQKMPARKPVTRAMLEQNIEVKHKQEVQAKVKREVEENYVAISRTARCDFMESLGWKDVVFNTDSLPLDFEKLLNDIQENPLTYKSKGKKVYKKYKDFEADKETKLLLSNGLEVHAYEHYLPEAKAFFSSNILIENKLISKEVIGTLNSMKVNGLCADPCQEVLCTQTSKGLKILMLDGQSATEWKEQFQSCDDRGIEPTIAPTFLLHLQTGVIEQPDSLSMQAQTTKIIESREFKILKIQAKILSGMIDLKYDEVKLLEEWIEEKQFDKDRLRQFILDYPIRNYPTQVTQFKLSSLHRMLKEEKAKPVKV